MRQALVHGRGGLARGVHALHVHQAQREPAEEHEHEQQEAADARVGEPGGGTDRGSAAG